MEKECIIYHENSLDMYLEQLEDLGFHYVRQLDLANTPYDMGIFTCKNTDNVEKLEEIGLKFEKIHDITAFLRE